MQLSPNKMLMCFCHCIALSETNLGYSTVSARSVLHIRAARGGRHFTRLLPRGWCCNSFAWRWALIKFGEEVEKSDYGSIDGPPDWLGSTMRSWKAKLWSSSCWEWDSLRSMFGDKLREYSSVGVTYALHSTRFWFTWFMLLTLRYFNESLFFNHVYYSFFCLNLDFSTMSY